MESTFCWPGRHDIFVAFLLVFSSLVISLPSSQATRNFPYRAAVYEHAVVSPPPKIVSRAEAVENMMKNVRIYKQQTEVAANKGAKIIVFPENGLVGIFLHRYTVTNYLEEIPDPRFVSWNPSETPDTYNGTEIQQALSRIAKKYKIYMVVNMGTKVSCTTTEYHLCPSDGYHQYNTNVVYSDNGTLIAVYHKRYSFRNSPYESAMKPEYVTFDTPFGKFATVIGIDIISNQPTFVLLEDHKIRNFALPSAWVKVTPFFRSLMVYAGFARANSINLLAAGLHSFEQRSYGSGLYSPKGPQNYFYETRIDESKLLIADMEAISEESPLPQSTSPSQMDPSIISKEDHLHGTVFGLQFLFLLLRKSKGLVGICSGDFCCSVHYEMQQLTETYALGVGNGFIHAMKSKFYSQVCALSKCEEENNCIAMVTGAKTIFKRFTLSGHNYKTSNIAPYVVAMNGSSFLFVETEWIYNFTGRIFVEKPMSLPLHSAVLAARIYSKDTLYNHEEPDKHIHHNNSANGIKTKHSSYVFVAMAILLFKCRETRFQDF